MLNYNCNHLKRMCAISIQLRLWAGCVMHLLAPDGTFLDCLPLPSHFTSLSTFRRFIVCFESRQFIFLYIYLFNYIIYAFAGVKFIKRTSWCRLLGETSVICTLAIKFFRESSYERTLEFDRDVSNIFINLRPCTNWHCVQNAVYKFI